jgi:hypothetical protein
MPVGPTTRVVSNDAWDQVAAIAAAQTRVRAESKVVRFAIIIVSRSLLPMIKLCHRPGRATVTGITVFRFAEGGIEAVPNRFYAGTEFDRDRPSTATVRVPPGARTAVA